MKKDNYIKCYFKKLISNNFFRKITRLLHLSNFGKIISYKLLYPGDGKIIYTIRNVNAHFCARNYSEFVYLTESVVGVGDERPVITFLLKNIKPGDVIYDIGAFLGFHAVFFAKGAGNSGKVVAFEPSFYSYQSLKKNIELNGLDNVIPINIALGNAMGTGIVRGDDLSIRSLSESSIKGISDQKTEIMPGDLLIEEKKLPQPNIVKIDVEGYEYLVIKGLENALRKESCRLVCCEVHPTLLPSGVTSEMVVNLLKDFGFKRVETYPRGNTFHVFCYKT
ncbi:MAG: FkbM family methyltransferase [Candidatus Staskawiczbacteria bacterium]|jgi:FkbM family methyltransferase